MHTQNEHCKPYARLKHVEVDLTKKNTHYYLSHFNTTLITLGTGNR